MINALLDTNVLLDALTARESFKDDAEKIFLSAADDAFKGYITANSMTDIYYLVCKTTDKSTGKRALQNLLQLYTIIAIDGDDCDDCESAIEGPIEDFEDSLIVVCAQKIQADYIISRDKAFLRAESPVAIMQPADFLNQLEVK